MPDYYSVMLEIAKDRATEASMVTCSTEEFDAGRCPDGVSAGERYLLRAVNEPCQKLVSPNTKPSHESCMLTSFSCNVNCETFFFLQNATAISTVYRHHRRHHIRLFKEKSS